MGIVWCYFYDFFFLLFGFKDSLLCQYLFCDVSQFVECVNFEGFCYGFFGDLVFVVKESLVVVESGCKFYIGDWCYFIFFKCKLDFVEFFVGLVFSVFSVFEIELGGGGMCWFVDIVECYVLVGWLLVEFCDYNVKVV